MPAYSGSPFPALVFDFDGTLINSVSDITQALNQTLALYGRPALAVEQVRTMVGDGSASLLRAAFRATGEEVADEALPEVLKRYSDIYLEHPADASCIYPGVTETLQTLAAAGVKLGLCTNKPERISRKILEMIGLAPLFGAVAGGDTLPVRKPDGRPVAWVMEQLGGGRGAMVGDGRNDVLSARGAGIPVVLVSYGYPRGDVRALGADLVIDRFAELPGALERLAT
ncbi:MAG TPA: HAD family hydrolase [Azospirillum sp.]|nr:HAD family hydrolase [Azospirillum sp.]